METVYKLYIDNREPLEIIEELKKLNNIAKIKYEIIICTLPLFDYLITYNNFNLENIENNLENIIIAIERKSESDLISSIKDGRYKEQSCRMENININNKDIYYLIEESKPVYNNKNKDTERKIIQSAIISLSYQKKFSILYSKNKLETAYLINKFLDKLSSMLLENNKSNKNIIKIDTGESLTSNIQQSETKEQISSIKDGNNYTSNIKINKKENITIDNIDIIMLMQIPNISNNIASALIEKYNNIQNLIFSLKEDKNILKNFKVNERKISKKVIENLYNYLHI